MHTKSLQRYKFYLIYASARAFLVKNVLILINFLLFVFCFQELLLSLHAKLGVLWQELKYRRWGSLV